MTELNHTLMVLSLKHSQYESHGTVGTATRLQQERVVSSQTRASFHPPAANIYSASPRCKRHGTETSSADAPQLTARASRV